MVRAIVIAVVKGIARAIVIRIVTVTARAVLVPTTKNCNRITNCNSTGNDELPWLGSSTTAEAVCVKIGPLVSCR